MSDIERFPISFMSRVSDTNFYHVVLGIFNNGRYGAVGLSRKASLMNKPLEYQVRTNVQTSHGVIQ